MELSPPLIIIVLAASGYFFCNWCNFLKYDVLRDTGQRVYLTAALCGIIFYIATFLMYGLQEWIWVDLLQLQPIIELEISLESFIAELSVGFSVCCTLFLNRSSRIKEAALERVWEKNDIDALCSEAASELKPISVTLDNKKVYIGLIFDSLEPGNDANLTLLPLYSGYRDKDTLEMNLTTKYQSVDGLLAKLADVDGESVEEVIIKLKEFRVVIPRSRIVTVNLSVNSLYKKTIPEPERLF
ncbi:MAG: hypothetical protein V4628_08285 [Pseudomonadota bacterium]